jgi:tRNA(Met) cytidine acetyltransferase
LWAQTGNPDLLAKPGWRVVRIAVHPALQRHGLGLRMLQQLRSLALEQGIHYLGSSFGASADLLDFWRRAGYSPVSIGMRRDGSSGAHGLLVLQGFDHTTAELVAHQRRRFAATLPMLLTDELRQLESPIVVALLSWLAPLAYTLETDDRVDVHDFVSGARSYEHCRLALWKATLQLLADGQKSQQLEPLQRELIVGRILQQLDWTQLVQRSGLTGKTQMLACLRKALAHVVV